MAIDVSGLGAFHFAVLASLRAAQLIRGCRARVDGMHKHTVMAQLEVSAGKVTALPAAVAVVGPVASID